MKRIQIDELMGVEKYRQNRPRIRPAMMALKDRRRLPVGEHMTLLFENRDTVLYQIQEMVHAENIAEPEAVRHEVETYNELIPGENELSATLLVEFDEREQRVRELRRLLGLEEHLWLVVQDHAPCQAHFDRRQIGTERLSSVQFVRFRLSQDAADALRKDESHAVLIRVDHPAYQAEVPLPRDLVEELRSDLS